MLDCVGDGKYVDTDDLDQLSYHYYVKAERLKKFVVSRAILLGRITGEDIEKNPEDYKDLID